MEEILAIVLLFGGGAAVLFAFSPIGRALADRIRGRQFNVASGATDPAVLDEIEQLRADLGEVQERLDFAERMLASRPEQGALNKPEA